MANSATAGSKVSTKQIADGYVQNYVIDLDSTGTTTEVVAADANKHIGVHSIFLQNNSANAGVLEIFSGTEVIYRNNLAAGATIELGMSRKPYCATAKNAALQIEVTGTSPEIQGNIGVGKAPVYDVLDAKLYS